jgi:subtilisin family serine protease
LRYAIRTTVLLTAAAAAATAQEPTISPALGGLADRDTVAAIWFFARSDVSLEAATAAIGRLGGQPRRRSRWLHAVSADLPTSALRAARSRSEFRHLQPVARFRGSPEEPVPAARPLPSPAATSTDSTFGPSGMPIRRLNLVPLTNRNLRGSGVVIAILDTGFETGHPAFASTFVLAQYDFVFDDSVVANESNDHPTASRHGTGVWSLLAANDPGNVIGVAPDAAYVLAKTEDVRSETRVEEDHWVAALEWADSLGATVVSSSLGYLEFDDGFSYAPGDLNGDVAVTTVAADAAAAQGITVVTAAGNRGDGFRTLITPGDGDSVITAGAEDSLGTLAGFSSRGPTADGRLKPDLVAPGVQVFVVDPFTDSGFARVNGTSAATPLLAGAAALIKQLHPTYSPIDILAALRRHADQRILPDSLRGWGRPDVARSALFPFGVSLDGPDNEFLTSISPTLRWSVPDLPALAQPLTYRLEVARDTLFQSVLIDTVLTGQTYTVTEVSGPGSRLVYRVTAATTDSIRVRSERSPWYRVPPWVSSLEPDDIGGVIIRDLRPTLTWTAPTVASPPGPFTFDVQIYSEADGTLELEEAGLTTTEFIPARDLESNTPYHWSVTARLGTDSSRVDSEGSFIIVDDSAPTTTLLFQNFPNPFPNRSVGLPATCIWFDLAAGGRVQLDILDTRGHVVHNLVPGDDFPAILDAGRYGRAEIGSPGSCDPRLRWDGRDASGVIVSQGVYLARLVTPDGTFIKRIVFMGEGF